MVWYNIHVEVMMIRFNPTYNERDEGSYEISFFVCFIRSFTKFWVIPIRDTQILQVIHIKEAATEISWLSLGWLLTTASAQKPL